MSWDRACCISTTSPCTDNGSPITSLANDCSIRASQPQPPPTQQSAFLFFPSSGCVDEQQTREPEETNSLPAPLPPPIHYNYHHSYPHLYSPAFSTRTNVSDTCSCQNNQNYSTQTSSYDISSSFQTPFVYEQYLTSLKSEQSEHLPYLFDNIIYPQPCSPPSPINDSITTYYQLGQTNTTTAAAVFNKLPSQRVHIPIIQPITYQQLSLTEPPSSNIQSKLPIVKRFYCDSNMSNTTTTTIMITSPTLTNTSNNDHINLPYGRLDSTYFGTYDIWQQRTVVGKKNSRREIDIHVGTTSVVSRVHFELNVINGIEFHLKCHSKNGLFINNNYAKMSSITILPKQCTLRFPSTSVSISFQSLLQNNNGNSNNQTVGQTSYENLTRYPSFDTIQQKLTSSSMGMDPMSSISNQSVPVMTPEQQVILVSVHQQTGNTIESNNNLSSSLSIENKSPKINCNSLLGSSISSCSTSSNDELNENQTIVNSPMNRRATPSNTETIQHEQENVKSKNTKKPPYSYAQLIVQAILSAPDKQMTLSQIYNFISAQYPYYEANNRGWQNSIRHNLSLNRYFIRLARKDNEAGKGSFWRLDQMCEDKLIDHAFRHRKQRANSQNISINANVKTESEEIHSPITQYYNDQTEFLLADLHTSNPSTPLSPMTSPLAHLVSPNRQNENHKRKRNDNDNYTINDEIEGLLNCLIESIVNENKKQKQGRN